MKNVFVGNQLCVFIACQIEDHIKQVQVKDFDSRSKNNFLFNTTKEKRDGLQEY